MRSRTALLSVLPALPLVLAAGPRAQRVAFDAAEGLTLEKTFEMALDVEMVDLALSFGGQEIDPSMLGDPSVEVSVSGEVGVIDQYGGSSDGRPTTVRRTFDSGAMEVVMAAEGQGESDESTTSSTSTLEGETVVFRWDEEEGEYLSEFEEGGDADLLEGLEEDMDYRVLLPEGEVSEGDSWDVDPAALENLLLPGGDMAFEPEDGYDEDEVPEEVTKAFENVVKDLFSGETTATFVGMREEDGVELAAIEVLVQVDNYADVSEVLVTAIEASGEEGAPDFDAVDVSLTFDGEGLLLWNVTRGHFQSFELDGDVFLAADLALTSEEMGGQSLEAAIEFEGSASFNARADT